MLIEPVKTSKFGVFVGNRLGATCFDVFWNPVLVILEGPSVPTVWVFKESLQSWTKPTMFQKWQVSVILRLDSLDNLYLFVHYDVESSDSYWAANESTNHLIFRLRRDNFQINGRF